MIAPGTRLVADSTLRRYGSTLVGGSPLRLVRLGNAGNVLVERWLSGEPVESHTALADRLLQAGLVHPSPRSSEYTAQDVTLVVPVKDNADGLARMLAGAGDFGARIVVDDGSTTPLPGAVRHASARGPAAARNTGWRLADTELVAFLDSDTVPGPDWLAPLLPLFADPSVAAVAPRVRGLDGVGMLARHQARHCGLDLGSEPASVRPMTRVSHVPTAALVVRRSALSEVDGFDEEMRYGEDVDLVWRLVRRGWTVRYEPSSVVHHAPRRTVRGLLAQHAGYGSSAAPLARRHPGTLAPARMSAWSLTVWLLVAAGRPRTAGALTAITAARFPRALRGHGVPAPVAVGLALRGHVGAGRLLAQALRRVWWPLALCSARGRTLLLIAMALSIRDGHPLRIAEDLSYGAGVWRSCMKHRTAAPLLPGLTDRR